MGFGSSFASGAGADMLQQILKQKFLQQIERNRVADEQRRAAQEDTRIAQSGTQIKQTGDYHAEDLRLRNLAEGRAADEYGRSKEPVPLRVLGAGGTLEDFGTTDPRTKVLTAPAEKPTSKPIYRVNKQTGAMEKIGDVDPNAQLVPEPVPPQGPDPTARTDRSNQYHSSALTALRKPFEDAAQRLARLRETNEQATPQGDAFIGPEMLTAMAGGAGSGLRMTEAEIARIVGGRSQWENLRATLQQWSLDPKTANPITPAQRQQITALTNVVEGRVRKSLDVLNTAGDQLVGSNDPIAHRRILNDTHKALTGLTSPDAGAGAGAAAAPPKVGDVKTFPNGRKGVWDGNGWVPQ